MLAEDWLERSQPGYRELAQGERSAVAGFSIIWSVFEAAALSGSGSVRSIGQFIDGNREALVDFAPLQAPLDYFQDRYVEDGAINLRFDHLNFRRNDNRELVEAVLLGRNDDNAEKAKALLIIVYRLRNNLFHGLKWAYEMRDQQANFEHGILVMTNVLDCCRR
ncbi:hypothetical protein [Alterinioella nitratireducens]|uniref:hypothetical protein n=1 Tax=Alterinioella nitratireducens TaxID=2735915 RepID=UPI001553CCB4|nr:hypothetical protein [Alterinioella nitratireducens]NPD21270.1 hypothetical protein [Alterinioella nitratireducens]